MKYYEAVRPKFQHGFQGEIQPGSAVEEFGETDSLCTKTLGLYEFSGGEGLKKKKRSVRMQFYVVCLI